EYYCWLYYSGSWFF
nr:immunoglobulin light chain junction region [Macaca mulatta]